ncbi:helix-turn-helix domain-containing protein [Limibaculum sp. FT325]|uniref:helix-turn-helix transcriptional regulator n=1 Tax=Thermohalobaculum sediminis TaxID=2939436 RepID=UPI0020BD4D00|nr:helix-turn-helix transcriptional regulator [Limibaculum sediminis]MCL5779111.1 helix-turn-helix domain-containing protein [Limibaculum sediminis]
MLEQEMAQLGRGDASFESIMVCGRDCVVHEMQFGPRYAAHLVIDPTWCMFFTPFTWRGDFVFNGREVRRNELMISCGSDGYATVGQERHTLAIGLRRARLQAACESLSGSVHATPCDLDHRLTLASPMGRAVRATALEILRGSAERILPNGRYALPEAAEAELITAMALLLMEQNVWTTFRDPGTVNPMAVVRRAKRMIDARNPQPATLADLCAASGVGKAWLHKCFVEVHGTSPMNYLRAQRLTFARQRLLDTVDPPRSVKDVSLSLGFANGGRFAAAYAAIYGETPTATLARNLARLA